jgi:hypothetical protein
MLDALDGGRQAHQLGRDLIGQSVDIGAGRQLGMGQQRKLGLDQRDRGV